MTKFRIVSKGTKFRVQAQYLMVWLTEFYADSVTQAMAYIDVQRDIQARIAQDRQRNRGSWFNWKVVRGE